MAIHIRVYPQPGSIGARRNSAVRRQKQQAIQQQRQLRLQQQLQQQQMRQMAMQPYGIPGSTYGGAYGGTYGGMFPTGYGSQGGWPGQGPWQVPTGAYPGTMYPPTPTYGTMCPPPIAAGCDAYGGVGSLGSYPGATFGYDTGIGAPYLAGSNMGWLGGAFGGW